MKQKVIISKIITTIKLKNLLTNFSPAPMSKFSQSLFMKLVNYLIKNNENNCYCGGYFY